MNTEKLTRFNFNGSNQIVGFVESVKVTDGVHCDIYKFQDDLFKDLAIIKIDPNKSTPLQRVVIGERTIEGYSSGEGRLLVTRKNGKKEVYEFKPHHGGKFELDILVGDLMQWQSSKDFELIAYEICFPPYNEGRFENVA